MMELMSQESPTTNAFSQGFIQWILDDTYVKTIEKPEYAGCVCGMGFGIIHGKSNSMPKVSSSSSS
jgi:hypothetical protein